MMSKKAGKEVGLPKGWQEIKLGEILSLRKDKMNPATSNKKITCIELEHIEKNTGRIISCTSSSLRQSTKNIFYSEDILYGKLRPNLRKYAFPKFDGVCTSEIWVFKTKVNICIRKFAFYLVQSDGFTKTACRTTGTKMPRADWSLLKKNLVIIPNVVEQKAIASFLEKWDTAIEKTEALIVAKEKQFKWLLKRLINDQMDNPAWRNTDIRLMLKVIPPPKKIKKNDFLERGKYPIIDQSQKDIAGWFNDEDAVVHLTKPVVIFGDHTCVIKYVSQPFGQGSDGIKILETDNQLIPKFLYFLLIGNPIKTEGYKRHFSKLESRKISLPPLAEQKHIISILNTNQKEIKLTKQLVEQYRTQKRGLMQKLLTGVWRIKL